MAAIPSKPDFFTFCMGKNRKINNWVPLAVVLRNLQGSSRMTIMLIIREERGIKTYKILSEVGCQL